MDLESWKAVLKRHLEQVEEGTLLVMLKLVMAEMERRQPKGVQAKTPVLCDRDFLRDCGIEPL